jgi:hypothetical protein
MIVCSSVLPPTKELNLISSTQCRSTVASSIIYCKPRPHPPSRTFISHHALVSLICGDSPDYIDITLDLRLGDESYELRIAAHHSLVVQSLTKELRRMALVVRESFHPIQSYILKTDHSSTPPSLQHEWLCFYPIAPVPEDTATSTSTSMSDKSPRDASGKLQSTDLV